MLFVFVFGEQQKYWLKGKLDVFKGVVGKENRKVVWGQKRTRELLV